MNTAFYPNLMWNSRFSSVSNDPFDNSLGFQFPPPEGDSLFNLSYDYVNNIKHLLVAQGHIPFTELPEMTGFTGTANQAVAFSGFSGLTIQNGNPNGIAKNAKPLLFLPQQKNTASRQLNCLDPDFSPFDDGHGFSVPPVDPYYNTPNYAIRSAVLDLINNNPAYVNLFKEIYPEVPQEPVNFIMVGEVLAEFEFSLTFAQAPIDKFAKGNHNAMTNAEKRGALIFFGKGNCVSCHAVSDASSQMFSDFQVHNVGTPQIYPEFGPGTGNVPFSELGCTNKTATGRLDFGREEFTGNIDDRYKFRSSPLRNVKLQPFFFHNGSFNDLKNAIAFHLNPLNNINSYTPGNNGVPANLHYMPSDMPDVMATIDPALAAGIDLTPAELDDLFVFVRDALYDNSAAPEKMKKLIPQTVPSGVAVSFFEDPPSGGLSPSNGERAAVEKNGLETNMDNLLRASVKSNPTANQFSVQVSGEAHVEIKLIVRDVKGNVLETRNNIQSGDAIQFGGGYQSGLILAELIQGDNKITLKLIKL